MISLNEKFLSATWSTALSSVKLILSPENIASLYCSTFLDRAWNVANVLKCLQIDDNDKMLHHSELTKTHQAKEKFHDFVIYDVFRIIKQKRAFLKT